MSFGVTIRKKSCRLTRDFFLVTINTNMGKHRKTLLEEEAADSSPKTIMHMAFIELGGFAGYMEWCKKNPDKFYAAYFKTSPAYKASDKNIGAGGGSQKHLPKPENNVSITKFEA